MDLSKLIKVLDNNMMVGDFSLSQPANFQYQLAVDVHYFSYLGFLYFITEMGIPVLKEVDSLLIRFQGKDKATLTFEWSLTNENLARRRTTSSTRLGLGENS